MSSKTNVEIRTVIESRRGCGYRIGGGLYLVSDGYAKGCKILPLALIPCPHCGHEYTQNRGVQYVSASLLLTGNVCPDRIDEDPEGSRSAPFCSSCFWSTFRPDTQLLLMYVGAKYYTAESFVKEARTKGISKRIPDVPANFVVGEDFVVLAHPYAVNRPGLELTADNNLRRSKAQPKGDPGIIAVWKPDRLEYVVKGTETDAELLALQERGLELVKVIRDEDLVTNNQTLFDKPGDKLEPVVQDFPEAIDKDLDKFAGIINESVSEWSRTLRGLQLQRSTIESELDQLVRVCGLAKEDLVSQETIKAKLKPDAWSTWSSLQGGLTEVQGLIDRKETEIKPLEDQLQELNKDLAETQDWEKLLNLRDQIAKTAGALQLLKGWEDPQLVEPEPKLPEWMKTTLSQIQLLNYLEICRRALAVRAKGNLAKIAGLITDLGQIGNPDVQDAEGLKAWTDLNDQLERLSAESDAWDKQAADIIQELNEMEYKVREAPIEGLDFEVLELLQRTEDLIDGLHFRLQPPPAEYIKPDPGRLSIAQREDVLLDYQDKLALEERRKAETADPDELRGCEAAIQFFNEAIDSEKEAIRGQKENLEKLQDLLYKKRSELAYIDPLSREAFMEVDNYIIELVTDIHILQGTLKPFTALKDKVIDRLNVLEINAQAKNAQLLPLQEKRTLEALAKGEVRKLDRLEKEYRYLVREAGVYSLAYAELWTGELPLETIRELIDIRLELEGDIRDRYEFYAGIYELSWRGETELKDSQRRRYVTYLNKVNALEERIRELTGQRGENVPK